jgi:hypothetical protein
LSATIVSADPAAAPPGLPRSRQRRILFIGLSYYSYSERIAGRLRARGHGVDHYAAEDRSFRSRTLKKLLPATYAARLQRYHEQILAQTSAATYDDVFFVQIHSLSPELVARLRRSQPRARFVLYNWDSIATHDYRSYLPLLDEVFTFDRDDAAALSLRYLPLFALPEYFEARALPAPRADLYFVGAVGTLERFDAVRSLDRFCRARGIRFAKHLHCSPAIALMLLRRGRYIAGLSLRSLDTRRIIALMNDSGAVFDFPNHLQSGYTMRFIENLCAGKRIVTSNPRVRGEPFYTPQRIFVAEGLDFTGLPQFLGSGAGAARQPQEWQRPPQFSLDHWLDTIFGD